jgi:hypothetical protein
VVVEDLQEHVAWDIAADPGDENLPGGGARVAKALRSLDVEATLRAGGLGEQDVDGVARSASRAPVES